MAKAEKTKATRTTKVDARNPYRRRYLPIDLKCGNLRPPTDDGQVIVHNHVLPAEETGLRGFTVWRQDPSPHIVKCDCGWAPQLGIHYRVKGINPKWRAKGYKWGQPYKGQTMRTR
jgi:hypothetical protein